MTDVIFVSYAREDEGAARTMVAALENAGLRVWWDREIPPGKTWDEVIGRALDTASCVLVLWSRNSVQSRWVREEADRAASRGRLIPVLIEKVDQPFGFGRIQAADLTGWRGDASHPGFSALVRAISDFLPATSARVEPLRKERSRAWWIAAPLLLAAAAYSGWQLRPAPGRAPRPLRESPSAQLAERPRTVRVAPHEVTVGQSHAGCEPFQDLEALAGRGRIGSIAIYAAGYVHGIRIRYGADGFGSPHGFTEGMPREWIVPDGERIARVEGVIAPATSGQAGAGYVSRLQFFTDKGGSSPIFGAMGGTPFVAAGPAGSALVTIRGTANLKRSRAFNRAVASMTFRFAAP